MYFPLITKESVDIVCEQNELIHLLYLKIHTNMSKFLIYIISITSQNCRYWNLNRKGIYTKNKYSYCTFDS